MTRQNRRHIKWVYKVLWGTESKKHPCKLGDPGRLSEGGSRLGRNLFKDGLLMVYRRMGFQSTSWEFRFVPWLSLVLYDGILRG